ncbi:MAG TPA: HEAT repeat domain-containing protein [Gemmatimonadales bacterium]|jgi:HEAT repeat protein
MATPQDFAATFGRTLDLFRDPAAKAEQKSQFRILTAMLKHQAMTVLVEDGRLTVNGTPGTPGDSFSLSLRQRLEFHGVREIAIPADPPLAEMFTLLRVLADAPADEDVAARLRSYGVSRLAVTLQQYQIEPAPAPAPALGTGFKGEEDAPLVEPAAPATAASLDEPGPTELVARLRDQPDGPQVGDLLSALNRQVLSSLKADRVSIALYIMAGIVRAEQQVNDATRRRQYSIALKRMFSKSLLEAVAEIANHPSDRQDALLVLRRAGEGGVEVLLELLVAAPTLDERRGIFMALTGMKEGTDQLVHMLGHPQWFVVRNVAELAGELGLEEAIPALAQQLDHSDDRVRKAVASALAKIGSSAAAEPLRRALRDKSSEVRMQAAIGVGRRSSALAMPLVVAMEEEEDESVQRELILALGRIGSSAAVQALIQFAQPGGRVFGRKPTALRVTSVEALRLAATPAAVGTLEGLTEDGDKQVRAAAQTAVRDLKQ